MGIRIIPQSLARCVLSFRRYLKVSDGAPVGLLRVSKENSKVVMKWNSPDTSGAENRFSCLYQLHSSFVTSPCQLFWVYINCSGFISTSAFTKLWRFISTFSKSSLLEYFNYISTRRSPFELALLEGSSFGGWPFVFSLIRIADSTARLRPRRGPRGRPSRRPLTVQQ